MQRPLLKKNKASKNVPKVLLSCIIGIAIGISVSSLSDADRLGKYVFKQQEADALLNQLTRLTEEQQRLTKEVIQLEKMIESYDVDVAKTNKAAADLQNEKMQLQSFAGLARIAGPGIEITLNDRQADDILTNDPFLLSNFIVHDIDLLQIVNELKIAGAEAIAINGTRMVANSRISCGGPVISVGEKNRFAPPFIITAVGNQEEMIEYFNSDQSICHILRLFGLECSIQKKEQVSIPGYIGSIEYKYAKPLGR